MQKSQFLLLILLLGAFFGKGQINTPDTCKIPFGIISQSTTKPYNYGLVPTNLPTSSYHYLTTPYFGKSQDAYDAYTAWKTAFAEDCGGGSWRVRFDNPANTVSEGIAYGMLLSAYAADKQLFDGLYTYYKNNSNSNGIMGWNRTGCSNGNAGNGGNGGATDAELDAAMALLIANCQWPNGTIPYNYSNEATALINAIKAHEIHPSTYQTINGDGWGFASNCRNPSYFSPAYYKEFALHVPADSAFWAVQAVNASYALLNTNRNATTGLVSNWSDQNGNPNTCNGPYEYGYDACRNPWRLACDVLWHNDANAKNILGKLSTWLNGYSASCRGPVQQNATYPSDGASHNAVFVSTWATGTMGGKNPTLLNQFYTETVKTTDDGYFGNTLRTIMLFMLSGNFWKPCPKVSYVELTTFTASQNAGKILLQFSTGVQIENTHFNLYYSNDQVNFIPLTQLPGKLNTKFPLEHVYLDERYINQTGYYKLTFTDSFGQEKELKTISVYREDAIEVSFAPNPFESNLTVYVSAPDSTALPVKIIDMKGRIVLDRQEFPVNQSTTLHLDIQPSIYFFVVNYGKKNHSFKIEKR